MTMITGIRSVIRYWWTYLLLGVLLIFFGLYVLESTSTAYGNMTLYFVLAFSVNGGLEIGFALTNKKTVHGWGWHLAGGLFDLLAAAVLFFTPIIAAVSLPLFTGFWLLFRSISIVGRCFDLPVVWPEKLWMMLLGGAGLFFSFQILYNPVAQDHSLVGWTGCALLTIGLFYVFLGIQLRAWAPKK